MAIDSEKEAHPMTQYTKLFVVYDPTREDQPALERAADIAVEISAELHVFVCIHSNTIRSDGQSNEITALIAQQQSVLDAALAPLARRSIKVSTEVEWDKDWYHAVVRASIKYGADMVLKSSYKHSAGKRIMNKTSDWTLMRKCLCPVMLVKEGAPREIPRILAAVDICAKKESYQRLNQTVIKFSKGVVDLHGTEVHYINAFGDYKGVPNRQELIDRHGIESDKIHIKHGKPEKVIVAHAKKLDVSLVVLGNSSRSGLSGALIGNTVEKVLDKLECDVLSMP
jgi:universal stress protein E